MSGERQPGGSPERGPEEEPHPNWRRIDQEKRVAPKLGRVAIKGDQRARVALGVGRVAVKHAARSEQPAREELPRDRDDGAREDRER